MLELFLKSHNLQRSQLKTSILLYILGMVCIGIGAVFTVNSQAGAGGYDALTFVLSERLGVPVSFVIYFIALVSVLSAAVIRRKFPKLTTFITAFLLGIVIDICKYLLQGIQGQGIFSSIFLLVIGMLLISFGVAAYLLSRLPANPIDDFVLALNEKGVSLQVAKLTFDVICFVLAFVLGGKIGWGSFVITLCLGPLIQLWSKQMERFLSFRSAKSAA